jgi:PAS domain S-box-containing protein
MPGFGDRVLDLAGALVVVLDRDGRIVQFNGACTRTTGYTLGQVKGKRIWEVLLFPEDRAAVQAVFEQLRMGLYPNSFENYWRTKNGERRYIAWVNTAILDEGQDVEYIVGSGIDITERKKAEDREREYAGYLAILSEAATSLVRSTTRDNIFRLLAEGIGKLLPQALLISVGEYDADSRTLHIKETVAESDLVKRAEGMIGDKLKGMSIKAGDKLDPANVMTGRLNLLEGGIHQATFGTMPKALCRTLEKLLGKPQVYGIGMSSGKSIYGTAAVFLPRDAKIEDPAHIETFVNQASAALLRLEAERRVQERERYFRALTENAGDIITIIETDGTIRYKSPAVRSELGYRPEDLVGENIFGYIHPEDLARSRQAFGQVLSHPGIPLKIEFRFRHRDGGWRILDCTGVNLLNDSAVRGIVANSRDVTDRVRDRESIRESEERYRSLVELSPDGCAIHQDGKIVFVNASGARLLGASGPEQLLGRDFLELAHPDYREKIVKRAGRASREKLRLEAAEERFLRLDGTPFDVEVSAGPIAFEGRPAVHVMFRDITQRQRGLRALQESEARYRTTLDSMGDLIHLTNREGRIVYINPSFGSYLESLGMDSRVVGKTIMEAFPFLPPRVGEEYGRVFETGQALTTEESTRIGENEIFTETRKIPVEIEGKIERVVTVIRDVTDRKRAEAEIREGRERFQRLADRIAEGISIYEGGQLVYANERALEIFGLTLEKYRHQGLLELAAPEERDRLRKQMEGSSLGAVPPEQTVLWIVRGDGSKRCVYNRCYYTRKGKESLGYFMVTSDITEKRLNELALIESEKQYRELFESNPNPMWIYDPQTLAFIAVNEAAVRLYGYSREEIAAMTLKDIRPLEDVPVLLEAVARSVRQKFDRTSRVRHRAKDGRLLTVEVAGHSVKFSGRDARLVMINDITERQRIEEAVRDSEEKFRALAEQSPNMIFINQGGRVVYANPVCSSLMGYSAEEFYSPDFNFMRLIAPEDRKSLGQAYRRHQQGQEVESYEYSLVAKDGRRLEAVLNTKLVDLKGGPAILGIVTDVTGLRRAQRELDESRLRLSRLVENMAEGVYRTSEDGRFLDANPAMARIFGYGSVEELMQADIKKDLYFSAEDRMADYPGPGQERARELRMRRRDGSEVWVEDSCRYIRNEKGQVAVHEGVLRDITERKRAEEALKRSEERYRTLVESMNDGLMQVDNDDVIRFVNQRFCAMVGYQAHELLGQVSHRLLIFPEDWNLVKAKNQERIAGVNDQYQIRMRRNDGGEIWAMISASALRDATGQVNGSIGVVTDISESRRTAEAKRESEERYRLLAEKMPDALFVYDEDRFVYANQAGLALLGVGSLEDLAGRSRYDFVHPDYHSFVRQRTGLLKAYGKDVPLMEQKILRSDGSEVDVNVKSIALPHQGRNLVMSIVRDITEWKRAERALAASEEKYRNLAEASPDLIFVVDRSGTVRYLNSAAAGAAGRRPEEAIGAPLSAFFPPEVYRRQWGNIQKVMETGSSLYVEAVTPFGGATHHLDTWLVPLRSQEGAVESVLGISRDTTDRKRMEQKLRQSEAKYRQIFEGVSEGIYRSTPDGRPLMANPALVRMLGHDSLEEALARNIEHEGYLDSTVREQYKRMMEERGEVSDFVNVWRRKDGSELVVRENAHAVRDDSGSIMYYEGTVEDITAQERVQQALKENERRMATLMDNLPGMAYRCRNDRKWTMEFVSRGCLDLTEYAPEELVGNLAAAYGDLIVEDDREMVWDEVQDAVAKGGLFQLLYRITTKSGRLKWIWEQGVAIGDGSSTLEGFVIDISPRMLAEEALFNSEHQYRTTIDAMGDPIHVVDRELRIVLANEAFKRTNQALGFEMEGLGKSVFEVYPFLDREKVGAEYRQVFEAGEMMVTEERHQLAGREIITETRKIPVYEGSRVVRAVTVVRDVTESKLAEQALRESEEKYRQVFDGIAEGIYRTTPGGRIEMANPALMKILGYDSLEALQAVDLNRAGYDDSRERDRFKEIMEAQGQVRDFEAIWRRRDGRTVILNENARAVKDHQGRIAFYEGTVEDVTLRKQAEQALVDEKNKLADLFQVSLTVAGTRNIPDKISLTMEGIKDASVFRRGALVIRSADGSVKYFGHYGLSQEEAERAESSVVDSEAVWHRLSQEGKRISNSFIYRIPEGQQVAPGVVHIPSTMGPGNGWETSDTLIVPLRVGGRKVGYVTFDDPRGGEAPTLEEVHLLELFANQLSVSIENLSLYDDLERSYYSTLKAFVAAMEAKDPYTKGHSENVRHYALKIANSMDLPRERINLIDYSALLHDIGKLGIREEILNKADVLSYDEYQEVKLHPEIGSRMVSDIEMLDRTAHIIHSHHEYFDGQGYPRGIRGEEIPLESRIISVADAFEAMTSDRPYRKAFGKKVAIQRLKESAGKQFDARIVEVLSGIIDATET